jgi:hypothetical protein
VFLYLAYCYTGTLFYLTNIVRHFPSLFQLARGDRQYASDQILSLYRYLGICNRHITCDAETSPNPISTPTDRHSYMCLTISDRTVWDSSVLICAKFDYKYIQTILVVKRTFVFFVFHRQRRRFGKCFEWVVRWQLGPLNGFGLYLRTGDKTVCKTLTIEPVGSVQKVWCSHSNVADGFCGVWRRVIVIQLLDHEDGISTFVETSVNIILQSVISLKTAQ